ncbi:MAG: lipopolysaccharide heptosyltransferase II [Ignavibacteria bacterium]|nr:lipopolysaccharide heptosyltransferase II [Ignavibacteria bacterium]MBI3765707.1 lipopolysaccharide heptosyltransferase II [Ignavibacteriales bacterium]
MNNILVIQTAFIGDVILTLPLIQTLKEHYPSSRIDVVVVPRAAEILMNHPALHDVIIFDKRHADAGVGGFLRQMKRLRQKKYDLTLVPHRSFRSAALAFSSKIPLRVGFTTSAGRYLFTHVVQYDKLSHEVDRNLKLLTALKISPPQGVYPDLYPSQADCQLVDRFFLENEVKDTSKLVAVAPGTMWNTKRWLEDRFEELIRRLLQDGVHIVLVGGGEDAPFCERLVERMNSPSVHSAAGKLSLLQSAELIRRCRLLVSNDSAPMHLAVAVRTPVIAIFGATVPEFGFSPYGKNDEVIEIKGLSCRPCSIHGGTRCPIRTFDCMKGISSKMVYEKVVQHLAQSNSL